MPVDAFGGEGIVSEIEVLRGDLADVLHRATDATTEYVFGDSITGLDDDGDGVTVTFENAPPRRFDLVVGADGSHSVVRNLAFGPEADCTRPLGLYGCWFTAPADLDLDGWFLMHTLPGGRVASVRPPGCPVSSRPGCPSGPGRSTTTRTTSTAPPTAAGAWSTTSMSSPSSASPPPSPVRSAGVYGAA